MDSNKGEVGVESIRIQGKKIDNLPLGQGEIAKAQLPAAIESQKEQHIKSIRARYPKVSIAFLKGAIREAENNIETFVRTIGSHRAKIEEYQVYIRLADGKRSYSEIEPEIDAISADESLTLDEKMAEIRNLKMAATPYEMVALRRQIKQFETDIHRFEKAVTQETDTIMELRENLALCKQRDRELCEAGVEIV